MSELLEYALRYAAMGWAVFPLDGKIPVKDEALNLTHGWQDASTHPDTIRQWWAAYPAANIGIPTGYNFWALDVDNPESMNELEERFGRLPDTLQQITGSGKAHFLFRQPGEFRVRNTASKIAPGIDTRGDGGYIVAPPSIHPGTSNAYTWDGLAEFEQQPILDAPAWLVDMLRPAPAGERKAPLVLPEVIGDGKRNDTVFAYAAKMRNAGLSFEEILASIRVINTTRVSPPLLERELETIARSACRYEPKQLQTLNGMRSAIDEQQRAATFEQQAGAPMTEQTREDLSPYESDSPNFLAHVIMQTRAFLSHAKYLYEYNGSHWVEIEETHIRNLAAKFDKAKETSTQRRNAVVDYIIDTNYKRDIPWNNIKTSEIPFRDGVYDIETGERRAHRKEDYLQTVIPHNIPDGAQRPTAWLGCLDTYFSGDTDKAQKIAAIQEFFGYCLMAGHARYKKALLLTGDTDCGKSTIPMAIGWMVGTGNCCSISIEDMDDQRRLAPILGKLVNRMGELKSNAAVADGGFKKLVSTGDSISVEKKFKDIIEYTPVAKHVIATNNLPTVNDRSKATFNRMLLIKFNHSIPKDKQTTDVYDDIREQLAGLVAWALDGAKRLYAAQGKFTKIEESEREINDYKRRENPLLEFIEDYCVPDPKCSIPRDHFQAQLKARGLDKYRTPTALTRDLKSIGIKVEKARCHGYRDNGSVRAIIGYRMRDQHEESIQFEVGEDGIVMVN